MYKPLEARFPTHGDESRDDELNISRGENDILKKEIELMSQKMNTLKCQNEDLIRQVNKTPL